MDNAEGDVDYSALAFETGETGTRRQNRLRYTGLTNFMQMLIDFSLFCSKKKRLLVNLAHFLKFLMSEF